MAIRQLPVKVDVECVAGDPMTITFTAASGVTAFTSPVAVMTTSAGDSYTTDPGVPTVSASTTSLVTAWSAADTAALNTTTRAKTYKYSTEALADDQGAFQVYAGTLTVHPVGTAGVGTSTTQTAALTLGGVSVTGDVTLAGGATHASGLIFTPAGTIASTNTQAAIEEVATDAAAALAAVAAHKAPLDSPTLVGQVTVANDEPDVAYPFTVKVDTGHADGLVDRFSVENNPDQTRVDVNIRGANLNVGTITSSNSNSEGGSICLVRGTGDTSNALACYKPGSDSVVGLRVTSSCALDMRNTDLAATAITLQNSAANTKVWQLTNTGKMAWGTDSGDTELERKAAGVLGVGADDAFRTGSTTTAARPSASTAGAGAVMFDTDFDRPIWSDGSAWIDGADPVAMSLPQNWTATRGSPVVSSQGGGTVESYYPVMLFDASASETAVTTLFIPPGCQTVAVDLYWTNAGAGSGDVLWTLQQYRGYTDGASLTTNDGGPATSALTTAPAKDTLKVTTLKTGVTPGTTRLMRLSLNRSGPDASDTLGNDAAAIALVVRRVT